jgi:ketosteroid isomerase-like protein
MKRKLLVALFLVILGLPLELSMSQASSMRKDELIQIVEDYDQAWNRKDVTAVERIVAANYVYFTSEGNVRTRQDMVNLLRSPKYVLNTAARSEFEVHRTARTAVVSSRWKGNGTYEGKEFRDDQRCSIVLTREGQRWLVLSEHCTQIVSR